MNAEAFDKHCLEIIETVSVYGEEALRKLEEEGFRDRD